MKGGKIRTPEELAAALGDDFEVIRVLGSGSVATVLNASGYVEPRRRATVAAKTTPLK